jgi:predicted regulator of Ras-like GTPase activity (Roadblock/LC7/MglB family)
MEDPGMAATTGFPAWLLTATQAGSDDSMEFCLASTKARAVIRPIDSDDANLFLVGIFSSRPKDKSSNPDVAGLSAQLERSLSILEGTAQKGQSLPKAEQVSFVLSGLLEADPGIRAVALHMDDGLVVASAVAPGADAETLSAIISGIFHSCRLIGTETLGGAPEQVYFQGENGTLIASAVRSDLILTVLLGSGAQIGVAETLVRHAVVRMARVVAPQALAEAQEVKSGGQGPSHQ